MAEHESNLTRRKFLAASLGCLASAGVAGAAPVWTLADEQPVGSGKVRTTPITRVLGRTGLEVPLVNAGAGAGADPALIQTCVETGTRLFDTDARYQNGRHEQMLGHAFHHMGARDKVIIMTKVHTPEQRKGLSAQKSKELLYKTVEGCLRRLQTDHIDILLVHDVSSPRPIKNSAIMEAMSRVKEQGKTRFIGTATHTNMAVAIEATDEAEIYDVVLTSINITMADDTRLLAAIKSAAEHGVGVIAMKTQAGGSRFPNPSTLRDFSTAVVNSAALKWVCHNENIATSIPGFATYDHLRANYAVALDPQYTAEEKRFLVDNKIRLSLEFCRQCRQCLSSCPGGADVPTLMRTHMYARQYGDFERARQALGSISYRRGLTACMSCSECIAQCANSVNIPRKIRELKSVYAT